MRERLVRRGWCALAALSILTPAVRAQDCNPTNIPVRNATSTWSQECGIVFTPGLAFDSNVVSAWALAHCDGTGDRSLSESICVETAADLVASTTPIRLTVKVFSGGFFGGEGGGNLSVGKFAFSYTEDARDQFADGLAAHGQMGEHWTQMTPDSVQGQWADAGANPLPPMGYDPTLTALLYGPVLLAADLGGSPPAREPCR